VKRPASRPAIVIAAGVVVAAFLFAAGLAGDFWDEVVTPLTDPQRIAGGPIPSFEEQACSLPAKWWKRVRRGYFGPRSGDISILPRHPAYMASTAGGWTHSGPWPHLQRVPIVFYGPGIIAPARSVDRPATIADIGPTIGSLIGAGYEAGAGEALDEVMPSSRAAPPVPRLIVTVVWDGGGWNTLEQWPDAWPNLARLMQGGVTYTTATVGSSPSVTPAVHTTLGTGEWPSSHGITGIWVRDEQGERVDSFLKGESTRFLETATVAERWDEAHDNRALIGMVGYEPWHLGMIGQGTERTGGDTDDAAWLNVETNDWITNQDHYRLPPALVATEGLAEDLRETDAADGELDDSWRDNAILGQVDRVEETPAFIAFHTRAMINMIEDEGYGADKVTDLLFTNYKQIDRVGHYFGMASEEVYDSVVESDRQLGVLVDALDEIVGYGKWVIVVTADHGQQPDDGDIDSYAIDPDEVKADINAQFGPVAEGVFPTEIFLDHAELQASGLRVEDIARWLSDYRLVENTHDPGKLLRGSGIFDPQDRIFDLVVPSGMIPTMACERRETAG
jgi:predicted AlkP superfamily pyrophosphatase or phosphodiesterase